MDNKLARQEMVGNYEDIFVGRIWLVVYLKEVCYKRGSIKLGMYS